MSDNILDRGIFLQKRPNLGEKCTYSQHNNTALIKQISLFHTTLVMTIPKVSIKQI